MDRVIDDRRGCFLITLIIRRAAVHFSLFQSLPPLPSAITATITLARSFVRGAVYYNVECELSRHRAVITVWDRPGFAARLPPLPVPRSPGAAPFYSQPPSPPSVPGPDNERVITPRWPTAVLLGPGRLSSRNYYSFYSGRSLARARARGGRFFAPAPPPDAHHHRLALPPRLRSL
jgi:hypothetical protein